MTRRLTVQKGTTIQVKHNGAAWCYNSGNEYLLVRCDEFRVLQDG